MTATFSVKNFDEFQHYKDRSPPWIKLYNSVLDDYDFTRLPDAARSHLLAIWLLASRLKNSIPYDKKWVTNAIKASTEVDLDLLAASGFIIVKQPKSRKQKKKVASKTLAGRKQNARPEREGERETEVEREGEGDCAPKRASVALDESVLAFESYNETAKRTGWSEAQRLTSGRVRSLKARLAECGGIDGWRLALAKAASSDFLTGKIPKGEGHEHWSPTLDFFLQAKSFTKLMEGSYDNRPHDKTNGHRRERANTAASASAGLDDLALQLGLREDRRHDEDVFPPGEAVPVR